MGRASKKIKSLSAGRAPVTKQGASAFSSRKGRKIIRSHHQLSKALTDAQKAGDSSLVARLQQEIESNGGLATYQQASLLGQSHDRGGDSSKVLVDWLKPRVGAATEPLRVLEVGALSVDNACSRWSLMDVSRIDLNAQAPGILQQDFMLRPLPATDDDKFDVISLSLVLNFVPSKEGRGDMLRRSCAFMHGRDEEGAPTPCLFLVLPAPCVENSRYMNEERLQEIMSSLGYRQSARKLSSKLIYTLWDYGPADRLQEQAFPKVEINPGLKRNNFCIVL